MVDTVINPKKVSAKVRKKKKTKKTEQAKKLYEYLFYPIQSSTV
jgi:hypothetical protein